MAKDWETQEFDDLLLAEEFRIQIGEMTGGEVDGMRVVVLNVKGCNSGTNEDQSVNLLFRVTDLKKLVQVITKELATEGL